MKLREQLSLFLDSIPLLIVRTLQRLHLPMNNTNTTWISSAQPDLTHILQLVTPSQFIIDVGANIGQHIDLFSSRVPVEHIIAFEPITSVYKRLIVLHPNIRAFNVAISSLNGIAELSVPIIRSMPRFTRASMEQFSEEEAVDGKQVYTIEMKRLDDYVEEILLSEIGLIKIDVEGHERDVLRGAVHMLQRFRPILFIEIEQRHHTVPMKMIFEEFESYGYHGFFIDRSNGMVIRPITEFSVDTYQRRNIPHVPYINNFLFLPTEREAILLYQMNE